jgi:hypothetical protein
MINIEKTKVIPKSRNGKPKMTNQELPLEVVVALKSMDTSTSNGKKVRDAYLTKLRSAGWTLVVLGEASGISRERVRQIVEKQTNDLSLVENLPVPNPPVWVSTYKEKETILPEPEVLDRLLELKTYAEQVRSFSPRYRAEAEEYSKLLNECMEKGVTLYRLSKLLGVTHGALMFRMVRYGYKETSGSSKAYNRILEENRKRV